MWHEFIIQFISLSPKKRDSCNIPPKWQFNFITEIWGGFEISWSINDGLRGTHQTSRVGCVRVSTLGPHALRWERWSNTGRVLVVAVGQQAIKKNLLSPTLPPLSWSLPHRNHIIIKKKDGQKKTTKKKKSKYIHHYLSPEPESCQRLLFSLTPLR